jgi:prevent-host-death family protein
MSIDEQTDLGSVNLKTGVIPVSKAAATLSELIKRTHHQEHIVVTQNGYPSAVIIDIDTYTTLQELARKYLDSLDVDASPSDTPSAPSQQKVSNGKHR